MAQRSDGEIRRWHPDVTPLLRLERPAHSGTNECPTSGAHRCYHRRARGVPGIVVVAERQQETRRCPYGGTNHSAAAYIGPPPEADFQLGVGVQHNLDWRLTYILLEQNRSRFDTCEPADDVPGSQTRRREAYPGSRYNGWLAGAEPGTCCETPLCSCFVSFNSLFCGPRLPLATPDPDAVDFDNPQATGQRLLGQRANEALADPKDERLVLARETKHDDTRVFPRRIEANVREANVRRQDRATLVPQHARDVWVMCAADALVVDSDCVVARRSEDLSDLDWEVLVDLEPHGLQATASRRRARAPARPRRPPRPERILA